MNASKNVDTECINQENQPLADFVYCVYHAIFVAKLEQHYYYYQLFLRIRFCKTKITCAEDAVCNRPGVRKARNRTTQLVNKFFDPNINTDNFAEFIDGELSALKYAIEQDKKKNSNNNSGKKSNKRKGKIPRGKLPAKHVSIVSSSASGRKRKHENIDDEFAPNTKKRDPIDAYVIIVEFHFINSMTRTCK